MTRRAMRVGLARRACVAVLAAWPVHAGAQPARPVYREIGDWLLACDNVRDCVARLVPDPARTPGDGEDQDAGIDIARKAGPAGTIAVRIARDGALDPAGLHARGFEGAGGLGWRREDGGQEATLSGDAARRFVRAIVDAPTLSLARGDAPYVSLRGLAAVLLAMDEAQGRLGTAGALARPGTRAASAVPAATLPPTVRVGPAATPLRDPAGLASAVRRLHPKVLAAHDCRSDAPDADEAYPLTASDAIVLLGCGRFAYQSSVLAFRTPRDRPAAARLAAMPDPPAVPPSDPRSIGEYVGGSYDPATRTFADWAKGRGLGDCGSSTEWTFDGIDFRLSALRWQGRCGGGGANGWPVLYRTRR